MKIFFSIILFFANIIAFSQTVEYYAGNELTGVDLMWFKFIKVEDKKNPFSFLIETEFFL